MTPVRSPNPSNANNERNVNPSGALNNNNANNTNGDSADREYARIEKGITESKALTQGIGFLTVRRKQAVRTVGWNALPGDWHDGGYLGHPPISNSGRIPGNTDANKTVWTNSEKQSRWTNCARRPKSAEEVYRIK